MIKSEMDSNDSKSAYSIDLIFINTNSHTTEVHELSHSPVDKSENAQQLISMCIKSDMLIQQNNFPPLHLFLSTGCLILFSILANANRIYDINFPISINFRHSLILSVLY